MQKIATINGEKIKYLDIGYGPPLVCLHGWAMHGGLFSKLAQTLSGQFRVICPDLAGHGNSLTMGGSFTIERAANDIFQLCQQLNLTNITALGWSMGAQVWWELMAKNGFERISRLVIEDMSPKIYNTSSWSNGTLNGRTIDSIDKILIEMGADWTSFSYRFVPRIFAQGKGNDWAGLAEQIMRDTLRNNPQIMIEYWQSMANKDYRDFLPNITIPTLVTRGQLSQLYGPDVAKFLCQKLPNSSLYSFEQSGHAPHLEQPERFAQILIDFYKDTLSSRQFPSNDEQLLKGEHHVYS